MALFIICCHTMRSLVLVAASVWSLALPSVVRAAIENNPLPVLIVDLQDLPQAEREKQIQNLDNEIASASAVERHKKRQWLRRQWAELTSEQREQLREQIREHRQRMREQQQRAQNIAPISVDSANTMARQQSLSPQERQEFRQWMRARQESPTPPP